MDDFGVMYHSQDDAMHLLNAIKESGYEATTDWKGNLYCGIVLDWNYKAGYVDLSMPQFITKLLEKAQHITPQRP